MNPFWLIFFKFVEPPTSFCFQCCSGDFVLICVDGSIEEAQDFVKEIGLSNKIIVASVVDENAPMQYQVSGLPHHTLIAPDGSSSLVKDTTKN